MHQCTEIQPTNGEMYCNLCVHSHKKNNPGFVNNNWKIYCLLNQPHKIKIEMSELWFDVKFTWKHLVRLSVTHIYPDASLILL